MPKKQRQAAEVKQKLTEIIAYLEQQGVALLVAPVRDKMLTYEIHMPNHQANQNNQNNQTINN